MTKEEIAKRFCKFELCTHRNGEGMCCLYNQDNCIFHRLERENRLLGERCTQLLKDKGDLTDKAKSLEEENNKLLDVINNQDVKIADLEQKLEQTEKDLADYQFNYPTIKELEETINKLREQLALRYSLEDKIKELEQENAELRNNGFTVSAMTEQQLKVALEKGEQLEKENAELKALIKSEHEIEARKNNRLISKLTKTKELLNEFMRISKASDEDFEHDYSELIRETEQFLEKVK